jgi:response regulator of citrate/malate metabolism
MQTINCVLLIDRDNISNHVSIRLIRKHHLSQNILVASNCKEARELIHTTISESGKPPGLILMESNIRFELDEDYKHLKTFIESNKNRVQVIILTNLISHKDLALVKSAGIDYILNKPLTYEDLINAIRHFQSLKLSRSNQSS